MNIMGFLGFVAKAKPDVDDGGGSLIPAAMGFLYVLFLSLSLRQLFQVLFVLLKTRQT